ncbi:hypothetical protein, partial [Candidatus Magnetaquicoccus inordinatus]|uniref:hypothetical protein n=1 Tax=Candidatus Magnetaquicoccus inordinatus TaxID=2496818 RepID=UPI001D0F3BC0
MGRYCFVDIHKFLVFIANCHHGTSFASVAANIAVFVLAGRFVTIQVRADSPALPVCDFAMTRQLY